ncbi:hypothetical protein BAUCODRAFT_21756 [Baudoinia panamericana UAMH 10762]|uniref:Uncharacterized protein n=1 Tax=Baudoinia panamericana (strain UAMH 10762) TaxID=717646 RepID=M2NLR4_BAUPA|nr:uncharacterized protein BAUCODRAFT_21756 [Baudoinia panamericana UAMH 10762]EMD00096.1 hypothetical protein BAUCODRAFT_21756 [Baudoinia panamericana UAMH 10762]
MPLNLTAKDQEILVMAFQCMENTKVSPLLSPTLMICNTVPIHTTTPVDNAKLAALGGYKNANTAGAVWGAVKKKMLSGGSGGGDATAIPTSSKKRTKASPDADADADAGTPSKKPRRGKGKGAKADSVVEGVGGEEDDDEEEGVKLAKEEGEEGIKEEDVVVYP